MLAAAAVASACALVAVVPGAGAKGGPTVGSEGVGDTFFPLSGNGGYDVSNYFVATAYEPERNFIRPVSGTVITADVTQPAGLSAFDLDFRGLKIDDLEVSDTDSSTVYGENDFERDGQELRIELDQTIPTGTEFEIALRYHGKPKELTDPDGSLEGWVKTSDGAIALGEPRGTPAWIPSNDHPTDKATFDFQFVVPKGYKVISNGELEGTQTSPGGNRRAFAWTEDQPMATYLATATIGKFKTEEETLSGTPSYSYTAVDKKTNPGAIDQGPEIIDFLDGSFGTYPFNETGAIVDRGAKIGYALETQTRPFYPSPPGDGLVAHELAHQWYGNQITLADWSEIWLNEGFAQWAQWWWDEEDGGENVSARVDDLCEIPDSDNGFWNPPPAEVPGPEVMFDNTVYERGGMTLQRLRELIGNTEFFQLMEDWASQDPLGAYTTEDFVAMTKSVSSVSDGQLDDFFADWLHEAGKPDGCDPV